MAGGPSAAIRAECPNATINYDGLMPAGSFAQAQAAIALDNVDIYIDAVNGSDANDGLTPASALQTFNEAVQRLPSSWKKHCFVHLAAGDYDFDRPNYQFGAGVGGLSSPLLIEGQEKPATPDLGILTTDPASTPLSYVANTPPTVNGQYRGASIRNLTTGIQARISGNTFAAGQTTFTFLAGTGNFIVTPGVDQFEITVPATNLLVPAFGVVGLLNSYSVWKNIRFAQQAETGFEIPLFAVVQNSIMACYNCELDGGVSNRDFFVSVGARMVAGVQQPAFFNEPVNPIDSTNSGFWYYNAGAAPGGFCSNFYNAMIFGAFMFDNALLTSQGQAQSLPFAWDTKNTSLWIEEQSELELDAGLMEGSHPVIGDTILVSDASYATISNPNNGASTVQINNSLGTAISVQNSVATVGDVQGAGNGGAGIACQQMSQVKFAGIGPTVTGSAPGVNDMIVGSTPLAYGSQPFSEVDGTGPTLNRIQ